MRSLYIADFGYPERSKVEALRGLPDRRRHTAFRILHANQNSPQGAHVLMSFVEEAADLRYESIDS